MRKATTSAATIAVSIALATLAPGAAWAHPDEVEAEADLRSTPFANGAYGEGVVSGEAELESEGQQTVVRAELEGLAPGSTHVGHIHGGSCSALTPGPILHGLTPITVDEDGEGSSTTVLDASLAGLDDCEWWVAFHEGAENTTPQSPAVAIGPVLIEKD